MVKQKDISALLGEHESTVSRVFSGKRAVSWSMAQKLAKLFPGKDVVGWKNSNPDEIRAAFNNSYKNGAAA